MLDPIFKLFKDRKIIHEFKPEFKSCHLLVQSMPSGKVLKPEVQNYENNYYSKGIRSLNHLKKLKLM